VKFILLFLILTRAIFSYEIEHFLLPSDGSRAEKSLIYDIENAERNIKIAMFMVTNKKLVFALKERAKKGKVNIVLIADKSYNNQHEKASMIKKLQSVKNISLFIAKGLSKKKKGKFGILHSKLVIIDNNIVYIGSANWTKSAFHNNYEILIKIVDSTTAKLYQYYFGEILQKAAKY